MNWLDSGPVKFLNFIASLLSIAGFVGGGFVLNQQKGDDWGPVVAWVVGGSAGTVLMVLVCFGLFAILRAMMRECPVCRGNGVVKAGRNEYFEPVGNLCPKCSGSGRIF